MTCFGWGITMRDIKRLCVCVFLIVCIMLLAACTQERVLASTASVQIVQNGPETRITDLATGQTYTLHHKRVRRGERPEMPYTAVDTPTIRIEIIENGFRVEVGGECYDFTVNWAGVYDVKACE